MLVRTKGNFQFPTNAQMFLSVLSLLLLVSTRIRRYDEDHVFPPLLLLLLLNGTGTGEIIREINVLFCLFVCLFVCLDAPDKTNFDGSMMQQRWDLCFCFSSLSLLSPLNEIKLLD